MRRTALAAATVGIALIVTGCSSSSTTSTPPAATGAAPTGAASNAAPVKQQLDATAALAALTAHAPSITLVKAYTADTDPNHLLGRPGQYTSKVAFKDSRIKDVDGQDEDAVIRGGGIEVFASAADASARAAYLEKVTKSMPALVEYDYVVRETAVLRVSQRLSPDQAKALADALKG
ncbi:hypothetical protein CG736_28385 [Kitasatospora sp. CB02891]|nr:hypothetical protein CG736_28385 [Kitasatospora sp. CB02891]